MHDQAASLRRQLAISKDPRQGRTIAVVSGKGGVGKSNVALNFSLELLNQDKKVLLLDLDVGMGNIDILLGLHSEKTIVDMFTGHLSVHDIIETGPRGLAYVAAGSGLTDLFMMDQEKRDYFYQQYDELVNMYDYIIFDMGAGATNDSLSLILASDECVVVTTPEPTSITDAYGMIKHILNKQRNMPISVIMNRSASVKSGYQALDRFQRVVTQFLDVEIQKLGILPDDKIVSTAVIRQIPYVLLNEKAAVSKAIKEIVNNYTSYGTEYQQQKSTSFVTKLKQFMMER
ncbi:flagellar biosynthesis protein FlhG [Virgibacillus subterraneus]|uniref:Flagellar biosynthesis protein FlhG n=1 Tax=Virgibacillus subterraneus TaxID=621109 RepID=A0A1H9H5W0_9BACI|nr:MinD/ParA family protein [Virgibacillus subterraneus]SEQ57715.1 flagellar biosynthesis protein FlhG [Virgibacillus subterraneus]